MAPAFIAYIWTSGLFYTIVENTRHAAFLTSMLSEMKMWNISSGMPPIRQMFKLFRGWNSANSTISSSSSTSSSVSSSLPSCCSRASSSFFSSLGGVFGFGSYCFSTYIGKGSIEPPFSLRLLWRLISSWRIFFSNSLHFSYSKFGWLSAYETYSKLIVELLFVFWF